MRRGLREQLDDNHAGNDEQHAAHRSGVQLLLVDDDPQNRDQDDPDTGPNGISDAHRNLVEAERQEIKRGTVTHDNDTGGQPTGEAFGGLQCGGTHDFGNDGEGQIDVVHFFGISLAGVLR